MFRYSVGMRVLGAFVAVIALAGASNPPSSPPLSPTQLIEGTWRNERGSVLVLERPDASGLFSGTFRSGVGNADAARAFPLRGIANGDVLGFSVSFGASGSVVSWTGQVDGTQPVTMWHLAREVTDSKEAVDLWGSVVTGSDVVVR